MLKHPALVHGCLRISSQKSFHKSTCFALSCFLHSLHTVFSETFSSPECGQLQSKFCISYLQKHIFFYFKCFQLRHARTLFTLIITPLAGPNLHNKVSMPTMPASPPVAKFILGKVQANLLVMWQKRTMTFFKSLKSLMVMGSWIIYGTTHVIIRWSSIMRSDCYFNY